MAKQEFYERRGTMIYTEDYRPGKARIVHEAGTVENADSIVERLNDGLITEESLQADYEPPQSYAQRTMIISAEDPDFA